MDIVHMKKSVSSYLPKVTGFIFLLLAFFCLPAGAATLEGEVTGVNNQDIWITVAGQYLPATGDPVSVYWQKDGFEIAMGEGEVSQVGADYVVARMPAGKQITVGMSARVESASPVAKAGTSDSGSSTDFSGEMLPGTPGGSSVRLLIYATAVAALLFIILMLVLKSARGRTGDTAHSDQTPGQLPVLNAYVLNGLIFIGLLFVVLLLWAIFEGITQQQKIEDRQALLLHQMLQQQAQQQPLEQIQLQTSQAAPQQPQLQAESPEQAELRRQAQEEQQRLAAEEQKKQERARKDAAAMRRVSDAEDIRSVNVHAPGYMPGACRRELNKLLRDIDLRVLGVDGDFDAILYINMSYPREGGWGFKTDWSWHLKRRGDGKVFIKDHGTESATSRSATCIDVVEEMVEAIEDEVD